MYEMPGGFNHRRKRNIHAGARSTDSAPHGIQWPDTDDDEALTAPAPATPDEPRLERRELPEQHEEGFVKLDGVRIDVSTLHLPTNNHHKITVYVTDEVYQALTEIKRLTKHGFSYITQAAIKEYIWSLATK